MERKIAVLGSTGSIGTQTLEVVRNNRDIQVTALAAGKNAAALERQIREFHPRVACLWEEAAARELKERVRDLDVRVVWGMDGLVEAAAGTDAQMVVTAVVGTPATTKAASILPSCRASTLLPKSWKVGLMSASVRP